MDPPLPTRTGGMSLLYCSTGWATHEVQNDVRLRRATQDKQTLGSHWDEYFEVEHYCWDDQWVLNRAATLAAALAPQLQQWQTQCGASLRTEAAIAVLHGRGGGLCVRAEVGCWIWQGNCPTFVAFALTPSECLVLRTIADKTLAAAAARRTFEADHVGLVIPDVVSDNACTTYHLHR